MKVVILAGGLGTRFAEETTVRPKPMVEIGGRPILHHIMEIYAASGFTEFVIALGYKQEIVKEYFRSLYAASNDFSIDFARHRIHYRERTQLDWRVHLIDTGKLTMSGGRIKRLASLLGDEPFLCTYGDGLAALDIAKVVAFHREQGRCATVTAVRPPARFGTLDIDGTRVRRFLEKPQTSEGWINGGFFVFEPRFFEYLTDDDTVSLEQEPLVRLAEDGELSVYMHEGFWQPMDTLRDRNLLEELWQSGSPPWRMLPAGSTDLSTTTTAMRQTRLL